MQIVRIYSGDDGESHFEDLTLDQFAEIMNRVGPGTINLTRREPPYFEDYHTAPRRQYVIALSGAAEYETADGTVKRLFPGDILIAGRPDRPVTATSLVAPTTTTGCPSLYRWLRLSSLIPVFC